jgi:hypothetical protein
VLQNVDVGLRSCDAVWICRYEHFRDHTASFFSGEVEGSVFLLNVGTDLEVQTALQHTRPASTMKVLSTDHELIPAGCKRP